MAAAAELYEAFVGLFAGAMDGERPLGAKDHEAWAGEGARWGKAEAGPCAMDDKLVAFGRKSAARASALALSRAPGALNSPTADFGSTPSIEVFRNRI